MKEAMVRHSLVVYLPSSTIGPLPQRKKNHTNKSNAVKQKPLPCYALWIEALPFCSSAAELGFLCTLNFDDDDDGQLLSNYVKYFCEGWVIYIYIFIMIDFEI